MPDNTITDPHHTLPLYCNMVVGSGVLNGVANLTLAVAQFTPQGDAIEPDFVINCRLRMDMQCLAALYEQIGHMLHPQSSGEKPN